MNLARIIVRNSVFCKRYKPLLSVNDGLQILASKKFNNSSKLRAKIFKEVENKHACNIMQHKGYLNKYSDITENITIQQNDFEMLLQKNWAKESPKTIFELLGKLGSYSSQNGLCISNKIFDDYIDNLTDSLHCTSDDELKAIFYGLMCWPETKSIRTRNFIEVWAALDDECINRIKNWTTDELLSFVGLFYMLSITRYSDFVTKCLQKMATKAKNLSPGQLVQTFFYISTTRRSPHDMHNLELHVDNIFSQLTVDDLAVISMGFFKSKTPVRNSQLILKIINKVMMNSKQLHEVSLAALLKLIRYSMKIPDGIIYKMLDVLKYEVDRLSIMCNVHLALVGTSTLTLHEGCLTNIANKVNGSITGTRLKDLERLMLSFGTFNFKPSTKECIFKKTMDELRKPERQEEIEVHGKSYMLCLVYLGLLNYYPADLINKALSKDFLAKTYGKHSIRYGREVLTVHNSARLFCDKTVENLLTDREATVVAKQYTDYMPNEEYQKQYNITEKFILEIMKILREERGNDYVAGDHIVAHHQRGDIIICNNEQGHPQPVQKIIEQPFGTLKTPPDNNKWIVLVVAGRNAIIYGSDDVTGPFLTKVRELKQLGFYPVLVPWSRYSVLGDIEEKRSYLNKLIQQSIKLSKSV